jgi:hypothetical protein
VAAPNVAELPNAEPATTAPARKARELRLQSERGDVRVRRGLAQPLQVGAKEVRPRSGGRAGMMADEQHDVSQVLDGVGDARELKVDALDGTVARD